MELFTFWVVSQNAETSLRFSNLLKSQNWRTSSVHRICDVPSEKGMAVFEVAGNINSLKEEIGECLLKNKYISMIAFGEEKVVPNSIIISLLETGVDDFFYLSADDRVILAKIKAHIRRVIPAMSVSLEAIKNVINSKSGYVQIDRDKIAVYMNAKSKSPKQIQMLTPKEFNIMALIVTMEGRLVSRNTILESIWLDKCVSVNPETIDKHIESLRKKLGDDGRKIKTVYGQGYIFSED